MLDHVFIDAIGALRDSLEAAFLERLAFEEGYKSDILLGDLTWETAYGVPGEGSPPRVRSDITLDWPTWSQTAYRSWYIGETPSETPSIEIQIVFRIQYLVAEPEPGPILGLLANRSHAIGELELERNGTTVECVYGEDLASRSYAVEVSYEGTYELSEEFLADGTLLDQHFNAMGGWITSTLVILGDLKLETHPPSDEGEI